MGRTVSGPGSRRRDLATRAAAVAAHTGGEQPRDPSTRAPRTRPVRVTVELSPLEHKALRTWCAQTSAELDLPLVAGAEVFRALLHLMSSTPALAEQVRAELERTGGSRRRH